jgi:hypothetical protein
MQIGSLVYGYRTSKLPIALRIVLARKIPPTGLRNWFSYISREPSMLQINESPAERLGTAQVEKADPGGNRREVAADEAVELAGRHDMAWIEAALDDAFEAGIISMIDPGSDEEEFNERDETAEDLQLRRELLTLIIGSDVRRRLLRRLAGPLILAKKIESRG